MVTLSKASAWTVSPRFSCSATELRGQGQGQDQKMSQGQGRAGRGTRHRHSLRENLVEQSLGLALLLQVGLGPLLHQLLQVVGVLLHA